MNSTPPVRHDMAPSAAGRIRMAWPPPGLEPIHDALWPIIGRFVLGVTVLAVPILLAAATGAPYWSLGIFGQSWWIPVATSLLAFALLLRASIRLAQLLRACARGAQLGYSARTMATVAADRTRDSGFVLQGARGFRDVPERERHLLLNVRVLTALLTLAAALWVPVGLSKSALLAYLGLLDSTGMWLITLAPTVLLGIAAVLARGLEGTLTRSTKLQDASVAASTEVAHEADAWNSNIGLLTEAPGWQPKPVSPGRFRWASHLVVLPAALLIIPVAAVVGSTALGPLVASVAIPNVSGVQTRYAAVAVLRPYRLTADPAVTPAQAGAAMHNLSSMGEARPTPLMQEPQRRYTEPWFPVGVEPLGSSPAWASTVFESLARGLTPGEQEYLERVASHPAHAEFTVLATAAHADFTGARLIMPIPDTVQPYELPIPRFGRVREGAYAHVGLAAYQLSLGQEEQAERTLREIISAGLLLVDDGPTLIESLIGIVVAGIGAHALENFYAATGRAAEAQRIGALNDAAELVSEAARRRAPRPSLAAALQLMPQTVADNSLPRGLRWETFTVFNSVSPCINLHQTVFGRDEHFREWVDSAEADLVRFPGERELFAVSRNGIMGTKERPLFRCGVPLSALRDLR